MGLFHLKNPILEQGLNPKPLEFGENSKKN